MKQNAIFLLYVFSIWGSGSHCFFVISFAEMFTLILIGVIYCNVTWHCIANSNYQITIALLHFLVALLIHPAFEVKDHVYLSMYEQFEALKSLRHSQNWWTHFDASYALSQSLMEDSVRKLKISSPLAYWLFPPSVSLVIWGGIIFKFPQLTARAK
jgi:hypothetical protein